MRGPFPVVVGFSSGAGLVSRAIRAATRSEVSRVWIKTIIFGRAVVVMEAQWSGVGMRPFGRFRRENRIVYEHHCEADLERVDVAVRWLGEPYDYHGLARFGLRLLWAWLGLGVRKGRLPSNPGRLLCAELVVRALPHVFPGVDPEAATPGDLMGMVRPKAALVPEHAPHHRAPGDRPPDVQCRGVGELMRPVTGGATAPLVRCRICGAVLEVESGPIG